MNKRSLQIQTNFLDDEDNEFPLLSASTFNKPQMQEAASLLEKRLSVILAKNFIACWKQLTNLLINPPKHYRSPQVYAYRNSNDYQSPHNAYRKEGNIQLKKCSSSLRKVAKTSISSDQYVLTKRNKSLRVINQEVENQRAVILQDIVDKLRKCKKADVSPPTIKRQNQNSEMFKKISKLEKMVKNLKQQKDKISKPLKKQSDSSSQTSQSQPKKNHQHPQQPNKQEQQWVIKQFLKQIQAIRNQIAMIKSTNQQLLKYQQRNPEQQDKCTTVVMNKNQSVRESNQSNQSKFQFGNTVGWEAVGAGGVEGRVEGRVGEFSRNGKGDKGGYVEAAQMQQFQPHLDSTRHYSTQISSQKASTYTQPPLQPPHLTYSAYPSPYPQHHHQSQQQHPSHHYSPPLTTTSPLLQSTPKLIFHSSQQFPQKWDQIRTQPTFQSGNYISSSEGGSASSLGAFPYQTQIYGHHRNPSINSHFGLPTAANGNGGNGNYGGFGNGNGGGFGNLTVYANGSGNSNGHVHGFCSVCHRGCCCGGRAGF